MYKSHYFVQEETIYNKYFIDNYDILKDVDNGPNIKEMQNNKYLMVREFKDSFVAKRSISKKISYF